MRVGIVYKTVDKCRGKIKSYFIIKSYKIDKLRYNNSKIQTRKKYTVWHGLSKMYKQCKKYFLHKFDGTYHFYKYIKKKISIDFSLSFYYFN